LSNKHHPDGKPFDLDRAVKGFEKEKRRRELRKATKQQIKPNRDSNKPRRRDWFGADDDDALFNPQERVMPRGEQERRRAVMQTIRAQVGDEGEVKVEKASGLRGTVIEVSTGLCRVEVEGDTFLCHLRGALSAQDTGFTNVVAVGDQVVISLSGEASGVVEQVLPRRSQLARADVFNAHLRQVIAANVDQLLIVASWRNPDLWLELIDCYVITAERNDIEPILCLNKIDLAEDQSACQRLLRPYRDLLELPILFTSAQTGQGIDALREALRSRTSVLAGMSGVGKSSLLRAVQPGLNLRISDVSTFDGQGRHTTTQAIMRPLDIGGYVIDTPGIREFGLSDLPRRELVDFYPEMQAAASRCRYADCAHINEQECAIKEAVARGEIAEWRYHNYQKLYKSLPV
jgi:ribosome biogenesis GTPase